MGNQGWRDPHASTLPAWVGKTIDFERMSPDADAQIAPAIDLARSNVEHVSGGPFGAAVFDEAV